MASNVKDLAYWLDKNPEMAAILGLALEQGAKISRSGEFIIDPSNIEEAENKRMRSYRYKPFPRHVHGWDGDGNHVFKEVTNAAEFDAALKDGWFEDNDPKNATKAQAKAASTVTHVVTDAASGRTEAQTTHPEQAASAKKPAKKSKAKK